MTDGPKILAFDLETRPATVLTFSLFKPFLTPDHIIEPSRVMCFTAQWADSKKTMFYSEHHDGREAMLQAMWDLLDEADIVLTFNGARFDIPWIKGEFLVEGMPPFSPVKSIDLYQVIKSNARFLSNKLGYVTKRLVEDTKVTHEGLDLWKKCMAGDDKAWNTMRRYAKKDTALLIPLYEKLKPWIPNHPNVNLYREFGPEGCPACGSTNVQKRGVSRTNASVFQRFQCQDCGKWFRGSSRLDGGSTRNIV